jgi:hypothetical protein
MRLRASIGGYVHHRRLSSQGGVFGGGEVHADGSLRGGARSPWGRPPVGLHADLSVSMRGSRLC